MFEHFTQIALEPSGTRPSWLVYLYRAPMELNITLSNFFDLTLRLFLLFWKKPVFLRKIHAALQKVLATLWNISVTLRKVSVTLCSTKSTYHSSEGT